MVLRLARRGTEALEIILKAVERNKQNYSNAQLRLILAEDKEKGHKIIYTGRIDFLHKDTKTHSENQYYDNVTLSKLIIPVDEAVELIQSIAKKAPIRIENTDHVLDGDFDTPYYIQSKKNWGYVNYEWPCVHTYYAIRSDATMDVGVYDSLVKPGLPAYPDFLSAVSSFLEYPSRQYNTDRRITIVAADYRARILEVQLSGKKVTVEVESTQDTRSKDLIAKFYLASGNRVYTSDDVFVTDNKATCICDFEPEIINAYLTTGNGDRLDFREINVYSEDASDLVFETPSLVVEELIRRGESQTIEFKSDISDNPLAETVVAFANTNSGIIIIGVDNSSKLVGFKHELSKVRDSITHAIGSSCEPPPKIDFETVNLENNIPVLLIRVPEGKDKPYVLRDRGVFVRRNATNRQATRHELDEFYEKRNQSGRGIAI